MASGWPVRTEGAWLANYVDGKYEQRLTGDKPAGIAYPMKGEDYRIAVDGGPDGSADVPAPC